jgi:hypothetical protein
MAICWECEAATARPRAAMLPTMALSGQRVPLCPDCYQGQCLRLIADINARFVASEQASKRGPVSTGLN